MMFVRCYLSVCSLAADDYSILLLQEALDSRSEFGDDARSVLSAHDPLHTLGDLSPDAL